MSWNLVSLCIRCHGWGERQQLSVDDADQAQQLSLVDVSVLPAQLGFLSDARTAGASPASLPPCCGCGRPLLSSDRRRRCVDHAHQQRAYVERQADRVSLLTLQAGDR